MERRELVGEISRRAAWPPVIVFLAHVLASQVDAYGYWPSLDEPMHLLGGLAIACFFARSLDVLARDHAAARLDPRMLALVVFALTCTAAVFWEFSEFVADRAAGTEAQIGLEDTLLDMLLGIVGGTAYLLGRWRANRRRAR